MTETLHALHECWNKLTGQELNYRATERIFWELHNNDFTVEHLALVVRHVLSYNRTHPNAPMKIQLHKICGDVAIFGSICGEAQARARNAVKPPTQKEQVLTQFRGGVAPESNGKPRHIAEVFEKMRQATATS